MQKSIKSIKSKELKMQEPAFVQCSQVKTN